MIYNYIVWVGGVDDYYINYEDAKRDYNYWINQVYNDVILEEIQCLKIQEMKVEKNLKV